jgi:hypothetical protein
MFDPVDCLGQDLFDYLTDLGFICEIVSEYLGYEEIDYSILEDDSHPDHDEVFEEWYEGCETCVRCLKTGDSSYKSTSFFTDGGMEIMISWGKGEIVNISAVPSKIIYDVRRFLENYGEIRYVGVPDNSNFENPNPEDETEVPSLEVAHLTGSDGKLKEKIREYFSENQGNWDGILQKINDLLGEEE